MVEENYNMKKIIFGITGLTLGGAERVLVDVANKLIAKYDVTIFTIYAGGELEKELDSKIKLISLFNFKYNDMGKLKKKLIPIKVLLEKKKIRISFWMRSRNQKRTMPISFSPDLGFQTWERQLQKRS